MFPTEIYWSKFQEMLLCSVVSCSSYNLIFFQVNNKVSVISFCRSILLGIKGSYRAHYVMQICCSFHLQADTDRNHRIEITSTGSPHSHYTTTATTTTEPTHYIYGTKLELHTIIPVCGTLLVFLILILCLRYHIYSSNYKQWLKRLRRASSRGHEGDTISINEEMFKPPPEYETAINMPKPCSNCHSMHEPGDDLKHCPCNNRTPSDGETLADVCQCKMEIKTESDSELNNGISRTIPSSDTCTITLHLDSNSSSNSAENGIGPYAILEHVQRMARDPDAATNYLPTYQDYIKEFPDQNDYV